MERTITFIAEHKKREYEQLQSEAEMENIPPQDHDDLNFDAERQLTE